MDVNGAFYIREGFANAIADANLRLNGRMESDCEKFGMTFGCKPDCPIFICGKCELQEENRQMFKECGLLL